jgi:hypothetical protein
VGDGPLMFVVTPTCKETYGGNIAQAALTLHTQIAALTMKEAHLIAHRAATVLVAMLAFVHNAYIEPPWRWFSYHAEKSTEWRRIGQMEHEFTPPYVMRHPRRFQHDTSCKFIATFGVGSSIEEAQKLRRSLWLYTLALESWSQLRLLRAAQYLFMAAEPLADLALPQYAKQENKFVGELRAEHFAKVSGRKGGRIPAGVTQRDTDLINSLVERRTHSFEYQAKGTLKGEVQRNTVFKGSPATYQALKDATDDLEHGLADRPKPKIDAASYRSSRDVHPKMDFRVRHTRSSVGG